jgi:hypothetical protein
VNIAKKPARKASARRYPATDAEAIKEPNAFRLARRRSCVRNCSLDVMPFTAATWSLDLDFVSHYEPPAAYRGPSRAFFRLSVLPDAAELRLSDNLAQPSNLSLALNNIAFGFGEKSKTVARSTAGDLGCTRSCANASARLRCHQIRRECLVYRRRDCVLCLGAGRDCWTVPWRARGPMLPLSAAIPFHSSAAVRS